MMARWVELDVYYWADATEFDAPDFGSGEAMWFSYMFNVDNIVRVTKPPMPGIGSEVGATTTLHLVDGKSVEVSGSYIEVMAKLKGAE